MKEIVKEVSSEKYNFQRHISKRLLNRDDEHKENGVLPKQKEIKRENDSGVADVG